MKPQPPTSRKALPSRACSPVYVRQTVNDITGEHTAIVIQSLHQGGVNESGGKGGGWAEQYALDFRRRLCSLLGMAMRSLL